ncbi:MAG: YdbH domain-containing protein [Hyphomicrobiales bacterium]|nr:YdbH domain-containing protein [Hyphomicrobiales bacterium]MCP5372726.1 YdbH domain-containing protein [Hyphomicrobiales bacterium]
MAGTAARRVLAGAVALLVVLAAAAAAALLFLPRIVETAALWGLDAAGLDGALAVEAVDSTTLVLRDVRIGGDEPLRARRVTVAYSLAGLARKRIDTVDVEGGSVTASLGPDGLHVPALDPVLGGGGDGGPGWQVRQVNLDGAGLTLRTPWGGLSSQVDGGVALPAPQVFEGVFTFTGRADGMGRGAFPLAGRLAFRIAGSEVEQLDADIDAQAPPLPGVHARAARLRAAIEGGRLDSALEVQAEEGEARARFEAPMPLGLTPATIRGHGRLAGTWHRSLGEGVPTPLSLDLPFYAEDGSLFAQGHLDHGQGRVGLWTEARVPPGLTLAEATWILFAEGDAVPGLVPGLADPARVTLNARLEGPHMTVDGRAGGAFGDLRLSALVPVAEMLAGRPWRVAADLAADLRPSATLPLPGPVAMRGGGALTAERAALGADLTTPWFTARVDAETPIMAEPRVAATFQGRTRKGLLAALPQAVAFAGKASHGAGKVALDATATLPDGHGNLTARVQADLTGGSTLGAVKASGDVAADVKGLPVAALDGPVTLAGRFKAGLAGGVLRLDLDGPLDLAGPDLKARATDGQVPAVEADLTAKAPAARIALDEVAGKVKDLPLVARGLDLRLTADDAQWDGVTLSHGAKPALFAPLRLAGKVGWKGGPLTFAAKASAHTGRAVVEASGRHDPATGAGAAQVVLHPMTFLPGLLQPRDLSPQYGRLLDKVTGGLAAKGPVRWSGGALSSDLDVSAEDLSFTAEGTRVDGLSGRVRVTRPWPLATAPDQTLTARLIDAGLPLADARLVIGVSDQGHVRVAEVSAGFAGGRLHADGLDLDPASGRQDLKLNLSALNVTNLLEVAKLDDASGSGVLEGEVPVTLENGELTIAGGVLATRAPGVIRYAPAVPPPALQGGGQGVSLMLSALKNFHYDAMRLTLDGNLSKDLTAVLHIEGRNPEFMDGYPFEFNLNVSGALGQLLRQGLATYHLPENIGRSIQGGGKP